MAIATCRSSDQARLREFCICVHVVVVVLLIHSANLHLQWFLSIDAATEVNDDWKWMTSVGLPGLGVPMDLVVAVAVTVVVLAGVLCGGCCSPSAPLSHSLSSWQILLLSSELWEFAFSASLANIGVVWSRANLERAYST